MNESPPAHRPLLTREEIEALVRAKTSRPHSLLGMHPLGEGSGVVVRALRPDARAAWLLPDDAPERPVPLHRIHPDGLFELALPDRPGVFGYRLRLESDNGTAWTIRDPYTFLPTVGDMDLHLTGEGRHEELYLRLGAHPRDLGGQRGVAFTVWAPTAERVSVVGDWNQWDGRIHPMRSLGASGVWEIFIPDLRPGPLYRFELRHATGRIELRSDPLGFAFELRPSVASRVVDLDTHVWNDGAWMEARARRDPRHAPMSVYEVHLGSWMRHTLDQNRWYSYRELAERLIPYVRDLGFTHIELMPVAEHPLDASWGYQVTGYFAPTSRFGTPEDLMHFVDACHQAGIGVLMDWVPAHFPRDQFALARFDGTALYEHADPRQGEHPDWGTLVFNYGRHEVRNFLIANALFWLDRYHMDGLRVDAVASMLYLDYSRREGEWIPNRYGGRENLEAIDFLKEMNSVVHRRFPGVITVAEESTSWPGVSHAPADGGLGFDIKWNMGFMNDTLAYIREDPIFRKYHQQKLTFAMLYAFNERFILPYSHDEVVHGKGSMIGKMPGDDWQKAANLRALYSYLFAMPGKKLLFMGQEFAQWREWDETRELDWDLLQYPTHAGMKDLVARLARLYREEAALWEEDHNWRGFQWIDFEDAAQNTISWIRRAHNTDDFIVCVFNFSPVPRHGYRLGVPVACDYRVILNSDDGGYWGSGLWSGTRVAGVSIPAHGLAHSVELTLPPLAGVYLKPER